MSGYREMKEVFLDHRGRFFLVSVPGADGYWMICHPSVEASCPQCGSKAGEPCTADRGHVVLTRAETTTVQALVEGNGGIRQFRVDDLRNKLRNVKYYRVMPHEKRKIHWRSLGLNRPSRDKGPYMGESINALRTALDNAQKRLDEVERKLKE